MSKLSKRAISILVISILALSFALPLVSAAEVIGLDDAYPVPDTKYVVDDTIVVKGTGVTSGAVVNLYWDFVTTAGLQNNTQGNPDGSFEVWMDVPDTEAGDHYIWVKDMETLISDSVRVIVVPEISLSASSGLAGERLDVEGTGFSDDTISTIFFKEQTSAPVNFITKGAGAGAWVTSPATAIGTKSPKISVGTLTSGDDYAYASVYPGDPITLAEFAGDTSLVSFEYADSSTAIPGLELRFVSPDCYDRGGAGHVDITIDGTTQGGVATSGWHYITWASTALTFTFGNYAPSESTPGVAFGPTEVGSYSLDAVLTSLTGGGPFAPDYSSWVLYRVTPQLWETQDKFAIIDNVAVDGNTYDLQPPIKTVEADENGSFDTYFNIPSGLSEGKYNVTSFDDSGNWDTEQFTIGACITLDETSGPSGLIVTIDGRGFTDDVYLLSIELGGTPVKTVDGTVGVVKVSGTGKFEVEVVIPNKAEAKYDLIVVEVGAAKSASAKFKVDGEAVIKVSPTYGTPGASITVKGYNFTQISGTEVNIDLYEGTTFIGDLVIAETESDGTFEDVFVSPAVDFISYTVQAVDDYSIYADDAFKVGLIAFIINPIYGEAGTDVSITGIGFSDGVYNLTFGTKLYEEYGTVDEEAISDSFYVPNVEPGTYDLTVIDEDENELTVQFTVTESTYVSIDPAVAPIDYNVTIKGFNFADTIGELVFVLYNSTEDWPMEVTQTTHGPTVADAKTDKDGNFTAWWKVHKDEDLVIGDYTINVTDSEDMLIQVPFSIVAARVSVEPRKAEFDRGDMIQFDINNDFKLPDAYIEIYNPSNILYWTTATFTDPFWMLVEGLYTVPYYRQTDKVLNPMELQSDAPMGTWLYRFYEDADTELMNGTFTVGPSTAAQVEDMLTEVWGSIGDLTENIDGITDELGDDIAALSGEIDDITADVQDMIDDITADIADDLAQVAEDTEAAVSDLEGALGDIAAAQNELASDVAASKTESTAAKEAAENAQQTSQGVTTLVYGAIAASLIAALAAVVSLMQISKKIA